MKQVAIIVAVYFLIVFCMATCCKAHETMPFPSVVDTVIPQVQQPPVYQAPVILWVPQVQRQYVPYRYDRTIAVPRVFGNRLFGPRLYNYYIPQRQQ